MPLDKQCAKQCGHMWMPPSCSLYSSAACRNEITAHPYNDERLRNVLATLWTKNHEIRPWRFYLSLMLEAVTEPWILSVPICQMGRRAPVLPFHGCSVGQVRRICQPDFELTSSAKVLGTKEDAKNLFEQGMKVMVWGDG